MKSVVWTYFFLTCLALVISIEAGISRDRDRVSVVYADGRQGVLRHSFRDGGVTYVRIDDLATLMGLRTSYVPDKRKIVVRLGSRALVLTALNPFVMVDDVPWQMPLPTLVVDTFIYVPLQLFIEIFGDLFPSQIQFEEESGRMIIRRPDVNITGVEVETKDNGSVVRIITTQNFQEKEIAAFHKDRWLNITLYGGKLDSSQIVTTVPKGMVRQIAPFQFEKSAQISILMGHDITNTQVFVNPGEVLVSVRSGKIIDRTAVNQRENDRSRWLIDRIILDPGHGGRDPGAVGPTGLLEKTVTLDIAKRLKKSLETRADVEVLLTRETDVAVPLKKRTQFANANNGKLFISIHCNGNKNRSVHGYSTYVLGTAKTQEALELAEKENSVIDFEESTEYYKEYEDAFHILNAIAQSSYLKESMDLARIVNESFKGLKSISQSGRGVYQAGFYVLIGAAMPRILVETAYISNPYEERLLKTRAFRQKIAESLCDSIIRFKEKYEQGIVN
ncbi:MAG TPA: hypothetical protein ENN03_04145 [bacterium]|nr:hypothetical protein [bacterium]